MAKTDYHIFVENGKIGLKDATDRVVLFAVYDSIVFIDEGMKCISSREFAEQIKNSDNYYITQTSQLKTAFGP